MFALVSGLVGLLLHVYVGLRLLGSLRLSRRARIAAWLGIGFAWLFQNAVPWIERAAGVTSLYLLDWLRFLLLGALLLLAPLLMARDLAGVVMLVGHKLWRVVRKPTPAPPDRERRRFLTKTSNAGLVGVTAVMGGVGVAEARGRPRVVEVTVPIADLPPELEGYRIVQLSDVHVGITIRRSFLEVVVARVRELAPDLIAITGDLVDGHVPDLAADLAPLRDLVAADGVLFVTGNHEYYWDAEAWMRALPDFGVTVLHNEHRVITRGEGRLLVAGVSDLSGGSHGPAHVCDPVAALAGAEPCHAKILLAHQPRTAFAARACGFDLQLSGHTHGGQFFPFTLFVGLIQPFVAGLDKLDDTWVYVNRGTGYWGPPVRIGSPPEITLVRLVAGTGVASEVVSTS